MNINSMQENKILYTQKVWQWMKLFAKEKDVLIITPLSRISELLDFKHNNLLRAIMDKLGHNIIEEGLNFNYLNNIREALNQELGADIVNMDLNYEKIIKTIFAINKEFEINENFLTKYLILLDAVSTKRLQVILAGFDITIPNYTMITVHRILSNIAGVISWSNVEQLVLLDVDDGLEIIDADKLKAWLELKTRTVLTTKNIDAYFKGDFNFQSFLIEKALKRIY